MEGRDLAVSLAGGRIAIGVVSLLAPDFVARTMTGRDGSEGATRLFARMVGARDLGLGLGVLVALDRNAPAPSPEGFAGAVQQAARASGTAANVRSRSRMRWACASIA